MIRPLLFATLVSALGCERSEATAAEGGIQSFDASSSDSGHDAVACAQSGTVDLLIVLDNSGSMRPNHERLAAATSRFIDRLLHPPSGGTLRSLHIGVVSTDLGTPGYEVPSCLNGDVGDDGLLNPIRNGGATRLHLPWRSAPPDSPRSHCAAREDRYPSFLSYDASGDAAALSLDIICNAFLDAVGCGIEQPLEAAYRALVERRAKSDLNAGFLRDDSVLAVLFVSDEDDGSVRDCRHAEIGDLEGECRPGGRGSSNSVFAADDPRWASQDINLRFYMYEPGSPQDPTWSLNRYVDPERLERGFFALRPGRANLLVAGAIAGVPIELTRADRIDWTRLLGERASGTDGYVGVSSEGVVSMRGQNLDSVCPARVVPACRREGSAPVPGACDTTAQYFAWPSRRIAEVVRRVDSINGNGVLGSICAEGFSDTLDRFAARISTRLCSSPSL